MGEDFFGNLGLLGAHFFVDGIQQVKGVGEHVARAAGRVADLDVFGFVDLEEVGFGLLRRDVVIHLPRQRRVGAVEHPQTAQRVFDEVAHDPVRGEELGGGRDVLGGDLLVFLQAFKDLVFLFRDVELVEPADDFYVLASVGRHGFAC